MKRIVCLALLFVSRATLGDPVDDHFGKGVLGLAWGTKLQVVQTQFPHGHTWKTASVSNTDFAYEVEIATSLFGLDEPQLHVHFDFNEDEQLHAVHFQYRYEQREAALYQIAETLGHDYLTRSLKYQQIFQWKSKSKVLVSLDIGDMTPHNWAVLHIDAHKLVDK